MPDRLQRFRDYMARLDAAADPHWAIEKGLYVQRYGRSVADEIAGRLELQPWSTHLMVGGIGTGKTTQLLMVERRLRSLPDTIPLYLDVSALHDLGKIAPDVLLVLAGLRLGELVANEDKVVRQARLYFHRAAYGYGYYVDEAGDDGLENDFPPEEPDVAYIHRPGVLAPPSRGHEPPQSEHGQWLQVIRDALGQHTPNIVLLIDSLDRLIDVEAFERLVSADVQILRSLRIGVALVGPVKLLYGTRRAITMHFDYPPYLNTLIDVEQPAGKDFILRVLRARADQEILPDDAARCLVELSGGVLRDLIGLARNAGEEAYLSGEDQISPAHVRAAADAFGRALMLGLVADDIATLQRVRKHGTFVPVNDQDLALLMTNRVLEHHNGRTRYLLHPTIKPLLEQLAEPA